MDKWRGRKIGKMNGSIEVTLIYKERVKKSLVSLDKAEAQKNTKAIDVAKKLVRDSAELNDFGMPTKRCLSQQGVAVCQKYFRDVGENTFVFDEDSLMCLLSACIGVKCK